MTHDNKLQVEAIKRGTVIDHIPAQIGFKLLSLFKLTETDQRITIGLNLPSGEMGRKDRSSSPVRQKPSRSAKHHTRHASLSRCCNR